jgi:hypothetical protein
MIEVLRTHPAVENQTGRREGFVYLKLLWRRRT